MLLTERYKDKIAGVLALRPDLIHGNIPVLCFDGGMTSYLFQNNIKIFDYPDWCQQQTKNPQNLHLKIPQKG
ncbi:hypothetical protein J2Z22_004779 [Paenibacillus forsythiae]|uniref:Uncharacterized protein n=1 Tax=Paenibacillus forsythiae TaxID=365616 RepID=A0ABU3HEB8_9BACL|nr:hypothetical protein [Paenibacillus forsythiae]MDT3429179.1 hypothetical protein [Paenibacillus forsythiae]